MSEQDSRRPGSAVVVQRVRRGCEESYRDWSRRINTACAGYPGFLDCEIFEPGGADDHSFVIVVRFASEAESQAWHNSSTCRALIKESEPLLEEAVMHSPSSAFGSWLGGGAPGQAREPSKPWKEALVVLLVLYPTVMLLTLFVTDPLLGDWSLATAMYASNMMSVALMTGFLLPFVAGKLSFWLNPVKGSARSSTYTGLAIVLGGQVLMVALFHHFLSQ